MPSKPKNTRKKPTLTQLKQAVVDTTLAQYAAFKLNPDGDRRKLRAESTKAVEALLAHLVTSHRKQAKAKGGK